MGLFDMFKKEKPEPKKTENKPRVFEDEFSEVLTGLISLCMELTKEKIDKVFAYCNIEDHSRFFNAFYEKDGKILTNKQVGVGNETVMEFLKLGTQDLGKLREICTRYEKPIPRQIKMIYNAKTGSFDSHISYDSLENEDKSPGQVFMEWRDEVESNNQTRD